jgi:hypothetical protein
MKNFSEKSFELFNDVYDKLSIFQDAAEKYNDYIFQDDKYTMYSEIISRSINQLDSINLLVDYFLEDLHFIEIESFLKVDIS